MTMQSINPATGEPIQTFEELTDQQLDRSLETSHTAFRSWSATPFPQRRDILRNVATHLRGHTEEYGSLITREMGKPIREARAEVEKCAWVSEYYADYAEEFLADQPVETEAGRSYYRYAPLGPVLAVMPWNFPFWQVFRAAAPTLMAGNSLLLKHASNVPGCAEQLEITFREAGLPEGVFQNLMISPSRVERVIQDPRIVAITLTGSERAGRKVAAVAGEAIKKTVMELGGSDPFIVLGDADLDEAARAAAAARTINSGQSCIAAKRFIVVEAVADAFVERFRAHLAAMEMGDPTEESTQIGPQARSDLREELHRQAQASIEQGGECLLGGEIPSGAGFYYPITLIDHAAPEMPVGAEETFGPVAPVFRVSDPEAAVELANASRYGLGGVVWSTDRGQAETLARRLEAGVVSINGVVKSDPRLPFGGLKASGYGRELASQGIREFTNIQSIRID